jgi:hypothetical protein
MMNDSTIRPAMVHFLLAVVHGLWQDAGQDRLATTGSPGCVTIISAEAAHITG